MSKQKPSAVWFSCRRKSYPVEFEPVADPDLQIREGGPGHPDPEIGEGGGGRSQKHIFSALRALDTPL